MPAAQKPANEISRIKALVDLDVLDTAAELEFDALIKAAALICDVPISLISLVDEERQWFKASMGLPGVAETPREASFCAHAILGSRLLEIPDATVDARFSDNPLVTSAPNLRFYAGAPLLLSNGACIGTLCVIDRHPRQLSDLQREALCCLADAAVKALEGRLAVQRLKHEMASVKSSETSLRLIVDNAPSMMAYWDRELNCVFANRAYERWFGVDSAGLAGSNIRDLLGPELFALNKPHIDGALMGLEQTFERIIHGPAGENRHSLAFYAPHIVDGEVVGLLVQVSDVSALKKIEASLQEAQRLGGIGSWEWCAPSDTTTWSAETYRIMGRDPALAAPSWAQHPELYTTESWAGLQGAVEKALHDGTPYNLELQFVRPDGTTGWLDARGEVTRDRTDKTTGLRGTIQDITTQRLMVEELAGQHELLRVTLQSIGDAVITTDAQGIVTWLNPVAANLVGWESVHAKGRPIGEVFHVINDETRLLAENPINLTLLQGQVTKVANDRVLISRKGQEFNIKDKAAPIRSESGEMLGAVLVFHDVTEQLRQSKEINYRAQHDDLTGLLNRTEFQIRLQRTLSKALADDTVHTLLFIDLDQFKIVNDTCGHLAGDLLLQKVAGLLKNVARASDTIARLGGDEFGLLLDHCSQENAERVAQQICSCLNNFRFDYAGKRFRIGASIGLVPIDRSWESSIAIMKAADLSCYAAKEAGRNRVHTWLEADESLLARQAEMQWATRLENAFEQGQFRLFAQRIVPINESDDNLHLEVLLRMIEADGTVVQPSAFLLAAERFHLASRIDLMVLRQVMDLLMAQPDLSTLQTICINLSGQSIGDRSFHEEAITILNGADASICRRICLEITETAAITNIADAESFIERVRQLGVRMALDDFGSGTASFGYLKSLSIDILKVDGQFVRNLVNDPLDAAAMSCFVDVARIMGVKIVAECVETDGVLSRLRELGVDYAQGYLFHRPEPIEDLILYPLAVAAE
ncbi:EAL domain-containing protein [Allopontixanthobacter sediminis]|uniref:EAL domain-containing protein n=1 Tax=Allopontixanthobacter sediminis TaxID=1689985 RepID=A0A845B5D8_9SPHN|nr:EAL domain-containing protein [Allopontixanthobacter sediminis]MXP45366.1 EAL domain-containing protein [Allopontixanthobacter sediminis]